MPKTISLHSAMEMRTHTEYVFIISTQICALSLPLFFAHTQTLSLSLARSNLESIPCDLCAQCTTQINQLKRQNGRLLGNYSDRQQAIGETIVRIVMFSFGAVSINFVCVSPMPVCFGKFCFSPLPIVVRRRRQEKCVFGAFFPCSQTCTLMLSDLFFFLCPMFHSRFLWYLLFLCSLFGLGSVWIVKFRHISFVYFAFIQVHHDTLRKFCTELKAEKTKT